MAGPVVRRDRSSLGSCQPFDAEHQRAWRRPPLSPGAVLAGMRTSIQARARLLEVSGAACGMVRARTGDHEGDLDPSGPIPRNRSAQGGQNCPGTCDQHRAGSRNFAHVIAWRDPAAWATRRYAVARYFEDAAHSPRRASGRLRPSSSLVRKLSKLREPSRSSPPPIGSVAGSSGDPAISS
jgi:hypothetical protein